MPAASPRSRHDSVSDLALMLPQYIGNGTDWSYTMLQPIARRPRRPAPNQESDGSQEAAALKSDDHHHLAPPPPPSRGLPILLFAYFREGPHCGAEAVHFAVTRDGGNFSALNNNTPVLHGPGGKWNSVRDPFIDRDPHDASLFHIVATAGGFGRGVSVIHYWNLSLASGSPVFGPHRLLNVMGSVNGTEECWAPEWVWDGPLSHSLPLLCCVVLPTCY